AGNIFLTGMFKTEIDFGFGCYLMSNSTGVSIFLVELDPFGVPVPTWCKAFGLSGAANVGRSLAVDGAGDVIVTGTIRGPTGAADFGGGVLTSAGEQDVFLAKFDATGKYLWAKRFGDTNVQTVSDVSVDQNDNIVIGGTFRGSIDFGSGALTSAGDYDVFVAK